MVARANTSVSPAYRAFRRLEAGIPGSSKNGWLEAWTTFEPGKGFTFEVIREGGSEYVRNKILRHVLVSEQQLIAQNFPLRAPLVSSNYEFADGGMTSTGQQRVMLKAARKSDGIVNGSLLFEPGTGAVTRIEGRLVKSPSFWVRDVDVTWSYAQLDGHVLPVEMTSAARVRMFGQSTFRMTYTYVSIAGHPTGALQTASLRQ